MDLSSLTWADWSLIIGGLSVGLYYYLTKNFDYFKKKNIPFEKPYPYFGSFWLLMFRKLNFFQFSERMYARTKEGNGFSGMFEQNRPILVLGSPDLIKLATVKDFDHFTDHRTFDTESMMDKNLFSLKGLRWKEMRSTLSPAFTSSKLRIMFELIVKCAHNIDNFLLNEYEKQKQAGVKAEDIVCKQEVKQFFTRFTNDAIATSAFGIEVDSLADPQNEFFLMGKDLTDFASGLRWLKFIILMFSPRLFKLIYRGQFFNAKAEKFFDTLVKDNLARRRKENIVRPDMIQLLMEAQANNKSQGKHELTDDDIVAQAVIFFFAGFETISITLALALHQLAENPEVQEKLHQEIDQKLKENNGVINYDILMKQFPYLDMVFNESQRRYPAAPAFERMCVKNYTFPAKDERPEYTIEAGEQIWVPVTGFHKDPNYFPEPEKFMPERFADETKHNMSVFLPFGNGPRMCIANRFAKMESKLALVHALKNSKVVFIEETQNPLKFQTKGFGIVAEKGYWLGFKPRH